MIGCEKARERLWPLGEPRDAAGEEAEARAHLEGCADCRAFFARDAILTRVLRRQDLEVSAPPGLRARVIADLAGRPSGDEVRPRSRPAPRLLPWLAAAAGLVLAALAILRSGPGVEEAFARDYLSHHTEEVEVATPDVAEISAFFAQELGVPIRPVLAADLALRQAVICPIDERRAAVVEYRIEGGTLAHYRIPAEGRAPIRPVKTSTEDGVCIVHWSDGEFLHALVADIAEPALEAIAVRQFAAAR